MLSKMNVLLIENNDADIENLCLHLTPFANHLSLTIVKDGETALAILRGQPPHVRLQHPYLILFDLNLPSMDGFTFLDELRRDPELRTCIVFVLTESGDDATITMAYKCGIAGCFSKAKLDAQFAQFLVAYSVIVEFPPM